MTLLQQTSSSTHTHRLIQIRRRNHLFDLFRLQHALHQRWIFNIEWKLVRRLLHGDIAGVLGLHVLWNEQPVLLVHLCVSVSVFVLVNGGIDEWRKAVA